MFANVVFSFNGNRQNDNKQYTFETDIENLKTGDILVVKDKRENDSLCVFVEYCQPTEENHKKVIKKIHKSTLKAAIRQRLKVVNKIIISKEMIEKYKAKIEKGYQLENDEQAINKIRMQLAAASQIRTTPKAFYLIYGTLVFKIRKTQRKRTLTKIFYSPNKSYVKPYMYLDVAKEVIEKEGLANTQIKNEVLSERKVSV